MNRERWITPCVWSPRTQSREPGDKSLKEKPLRPNTFKFNHHAKNHSLLTSVGVKDTRRSGPSLLSHINHDWAFLIFWLEDLSAAPHIMGQLLSDISFTPTEAAVSHSFSGPTDQRKALWGPGQSVTPTGPSRDLKLVREWRFSCNDCICNKILYYYALHV